MVQTCWHTSALPESVRTACSTCGFKSRHSNQDECLSKLDYVLNLARYSYGQLMITVTNCQYTVNTENVRALRVFMGLNSPEQPPQGPLPSPMVLEPMSVPPGFSVLPPCHHKVLVSTSAPTSPCPATGSYSFYIKKIIGYGC